jgi:hypothetical protein
VDSWEGVTVSLTGATAFVLLRGHHNYFDEAGWEPDEVKQWQLEVANIDGVWKIRTKAAVRLEHADNGVPADR